MVEQRLHFCDSCDKELDDDEALVIVDKVTNIKYMFCNCKCKHIYEVANGKID